MTGHSPVHTFNPSARLWSRRKVHIIQVLNQSEVPITPWGRSVGLRVLVSSRMDIACPEAVAAGNLDEFDFTPDFETLGIAFG